MKDKMIRPRVFNTFESASSLFLERAKSKIPNYDKVPCGFNSSERMGGWIIKDHDNIFIGWVGNLGDIQVYDYIDRTAQ
tara:strand:+ start:1373 stop:1609 length:237 start_codon:yes stop_codon:yes gene_type:complete